jgi:O-methyltransferase involved in polyketide biosynthesis
MKTQIKVELGDIQKTLFMPVWARVVETSKNKPILVDNTARRLL